MKRTVVFIMGAGHCGSTLLDLILGSHSRAFSLGEFSRISTVLDKGPGVASAICGVCDGRCAFWDERVSSTLLRALYSTKTPLNKLSARLLRQLTNPYAMLLRASGRPIAVDSSKRVAWIGRQLRPARVWHDIQPALIYLGRDGRAVVSSYFRKYPERGFAAITRSWLAQIAEMDRFYQQFSAGKKVELVYEELAEQPERVARSLCQWLGLEFEPEMLRYWKHSHHHVFGNGGTRSLIFRYREQFGTASSQFARRVQAARQHFDATYYDQVEYGIHLDERWRRELTPEQLAEFRDIAGEVNQRYARSEKAA